MNQYKKIHKLRRTAALFISFVILTLFLLVNNQYNKGEVNQSTTTKNDSLANSKLALNALDKLDVKGRSPKSGYSRDEFGGDWTIFGGCDTRNLILKRDLVDKQFDEDNCVVISGILVDPYTGEDIAFVRGAGSSNEVQIDHIVALSDAWQKGAQLIDAQSRINFANDSLNLLAVDGRSNMNKSDSDAASWLPPNKSYRCKYVARQISVKLKYSLWVTLAEEQAIRRVLSKCPAQPLPQVQS